MSAPTVNSWLTDSWTVTSSWAVSGTFTRLIPDSYRLDSAPVDFEDLNLGNTYLPSDEDYDDFLLDLVNDAIDAEAELERRKRNSWGEYQRVGEYDPCNSDPSTHSYVVNLGADKDKGGLWTCIPTACGDPDCYALELLPVLRARRLIRSGLEHDRALRRMAGGRVIDMVKQVRLVWYAFEARKSFVEIVRRAGGWAYMIPTVRTIWGPSEHQHPEAGMVVAIVSPNVTRRHWEPIASKVLSGVYVHERSLNSVYGYVDTTVDAAEIYLGQAIKAKLPRTKIRGSGLPSADPRFRIHPPDPCAYTDPTLPPVQQTHVWNVKSGPGKPCWYCGKPTTPRFTVSKRTRPDQTPVELIEELGYEVEEIVVSPGGVSFVRGLKGS